MITELIVIAVSFFVSTFAGILVSTKVSEHRLSEIEKKLDIHNGYAEKLGSMAIDLAEMRINVDWIKKEMRK